MKKYLVKYHGFSNVYTLAYADTPELLADALAHGYEQITRKEAIRLCATENDHRKYDPSFSGFGDNRICPYDAEFHDLNNYEQNGYIMERRG